MQKKSLFSNILELIIPKLCSACHRKLSEGEKIICTECRIMMPYTYDWLLRENYAYTLLNSDYRVEWASSFCFYRKNDHFSNAILNLKFRNQRESAVEFGAMFANEIVSSNSLPFAVDIVVGVPLHRVKRLWRGYNQSDLIARGMAKVLGCEVGENCVKRVIYNKTQSRTKGRRERMKNAEGIFSVVDGDRLDGKHILLVDDVLTTGATLHSLIKTIFDSCENCKISVATLVRTDRSTNSHNI